MGERKYLLIKYRTMDCTILARFNTGMIIASSTQNRVIKIENGDPTKPTARLYADQEFALAALKAVAQEDAGDNNRVVFETREGDSMISLASMPGIGGPH